MRVALGADRWRVVGPSVGRPVVQIGLGIAAGSILVVLAFVGLFESTPIPAETGLIAAYAAVMVAVCLSACILPTHRAVRLEPSAVLKAEG